MITKLFEFINNKDLVISTINNTLLKIMKINNNKSINFHKMRSDDLVLTIQFEVIVDYKKQTIIEIKKLRNQLLKSGTFFTYKSTTKHQMKFENENDKESFDFVIDYELPQLEEFIMNIKDTHYNRVKPPRYLYHKTGHENFRSIYENGLEIRENEKYKLEPHFDHPKGIYASSEQDFFGYSNEDEWRIDTTKINNKWWRDYNLYNKDQQKKSFVTYEPIPPSAIELIKTDNN